MLSNLEKKKVWPQSKENEREERIKLEKRRLNKYFNNNEKKKSENYK